MRRALVIALFAVSAAAAFGCGRQADVSARGAADPPPELVVRAWADDMRRGDIDAATSRFAIPALVVNGSPAARLETRVQVRGFNATLPCGGRVVRTTRRGRFVIATFVLTERPGGDCGSGTGARAKTAFEVRGGKIVRWLRVPVGDEPPAPTGPLV